MKKVSGFLKVENGEAYLNSSAVNLFCVAHSKHEAETQEKWVFLAVINERSYILKTCESKEEAHLAMNSFLENLGE